MKFLFNILINTGIRDEFPIYLQKRIRLANLFSLLLFSFIILPILILNLLMFPQLKFVLLLGPSVILLTFIFNSVGKHQLSRVLISVFPVALILVYQSIMAKSGETYFVGFLSIQISFSLIPFLLFDFREKQYIIALSIVNLLLINSFHFTNELIEVQLDGSFFRQGTLSQILLFVGVIFSFLIFVALNYLNSRSEIETENLLRKNTVLLREMKIKQIKMQQSEQKLKTQIEKIQEVQIAEKQRNWAIEGLSDLSVLPRSANNLQAVSDLVISKLVNYVGANQGAIYLIIKENHKKYIQLSSSYAYQKKRNRTKKIRIGEGLLGRAYYERKTVYLTDIPEDYTKISSGIGEASPRALLIVPIQAQKNLEGFIEIASFEYFDLHKIKFVEQLAENLAMAIESIKINERTKIQAEKLRQQDEKYVFKISSLQATIQRLEDEKRREKNL